VHTANAETVNYIIARSDILSTLGVVLAVLMFTSTGVARRWHLYLIPAAGGVLAKEQGLMVAPLLFLYVAFFERKWALKELLQPRHIILALKDTWPSFVVCGGIVAAGMRLSTTFTPGGSRWPYLLTQPFVLLHYVFTFLLPFNLSADTDWKPIANPFDDRVLVGLIFVGLALWAAVATSRRRETRPMAFGILWFFVAVAPTSSVVPFAEVTNDHRVFFPFVGLALAATWAVALAIDARASRANAGAWTKPAIAVAAIALLFAHVYGTRQRNVVWHTEESLWLDVTNKSPQNGRGLMAYGVIQMGKGRLDLAEQYFNRALQYTPNYAYLHVNIGVLKGAQGDAAAAERHFLDAQKFDAVNPVSYYYYARWLDSVGRTEDAIPLARRALELSPNDVQSQELLQAIDARRRTRPGATPAGTPETPEQWLNLSLRQYRAAQYEDCIYSSQQALNLRPDYVDAFNNICAAANALGRYGEAVSACEQALAITPDYALARNNLAVAKANQKK
jgi:tetratricopeptide (TPR) repeat protein